MAPSISDQIRLEYAVEGSGLAGGRYNVRKFVRDVGKLTQLQKTVGTKSQRRASRSPVGNTTFESLYATSAS